MLLLVARVSNGASSLASPLELFVDVVVVVDPVIILLYTKGDALTYT